MAIHNSKVVGSSPTPATNFPLFFNNLRTMGSSNRFRVGSNLCPEQTLGSCSDRALVLEGNSFKLFTFPPILYHFPTVFCPGDAAQKTRTHVLGVTVGSKLPRSPPVTASEIGYVIIGAAWDSAVGAIGSKGEILFEALQQASCLTSVAQH